MRVRATSVKYGDLTARDFANSQFNMPAALYLPARMVLGWNRPRIQILGSELAGDIEAVGSHVTKFEPGDAVFAYVGMKMGANAEYICLPESGSVALKPANLDYAEAATLPYGAMAVQLARHHYGAEVTGVCGAPRLDYVKALGADRVIDYKKQDFTQDGETYDLIFDILGRISFSRAKGSLKPDGTLFYASFKGRALFDALMTALFSSKKVICAMAEEKVESLLLVKELAEAGNVKAPVDKRFPLEQTAEAHRYVEQGHRTGNVVIVVEYGKKT